MSGRAAPSGQRETEGERQREVCETEEEDKGERLPYLFFPLLFLARLKKTKKKTLYFPSAAGKKSNSFSWNWQVFVSGQLTIFSLPVMKVVAGVSALGGNGGLFIPLKAQRHTCFAWSVICNCGISWEAQEQSTLCFERAPPAQLKGVRGKSKTERQTHTPLILSFFFYIFTPSPSLSFLSKRIYFSPSLAQDVWLFWLRVELAVFFSL